MTTTGNTLFNTQDGCTWQPTQDAHRHDDEQSSSIASSFSDLEGLSRAVHLGIAGVGFDKPSPVQAAAIPALLAGRDVIAEAPSGSGKTAAYAVPALESVDTRLDETQVLILVPTRTLAEQVGSVVGDLGKHVGELRVATLVSGAWVDLKSRPHVVVAVAPARQHEGDNTPDKLLDLLERGRLSLKHLRLLVLDEADELLDRFEFQTGVRLIVSELPSSAQVGLFSATLTDSSLDTARKIARPGPDETTIVRASNEDEASGGAQVRPAIQHRHVSIGPRTDLVWEARCDCVEDLCSIFAAASTIVFVRTKKQLEFLGQALEADSPGSPYTTQLARFKSGSKTGARVLIATDACGRGIDVQSVAVVINFELPTQLEAGRHCAAAEKYVQRAGRAGRFGRAGVCITLVDEAEEGSLLSWLERRTGLAIPALSSVEELPGFGQAAVHAAPPPAPARPPQPDRSVAVASPPAPAAAAAAAEPPPPNAEALAVAIAEAKAAVARADAAEKLLAEVREEYDTTVRSLQEENAELEEHVDMLVSQLNYHDEGNNKSDEGVEEEAEAEHEDGVMVGAVWCGELPSVERSVVETDRDEGVLVGAVWCGADVASHGRASSPAASSTCSTATATATATTSTASAEDSRAASSASCVAAGVVANDCSSSLSSGGASHQANVLTRRRITFGKALIATSKLVKGERYVGRVVKLLKGGDKGSRCSGAFVQFGDEGGVSEKDGLVRALPKDIAVGQFVNVAVKSVQPKRGVAGGKGGLQVDLSLV